jgi:hypothetical protein
MYFSSLPCVLHAPPTSSPLLDYPDNILWHSYGIQNSVTTKFQPKNKKRNRENYAVWILFIFTLHVVSQVKVKGKPRHEDVLGSGGIAPRILNLGTRWRWVVSSTPRHLYPKGKSPWDPLDRRLGGPQSRSGCGGEEKNSQPPPGIEP